MKRNMGNFDRSIRLVIAIFLMVIYFLGIVDGFPGFLGLVIALILGFTSLISFCPLYRLFGLNTGKHRFQK